MSAADVEMPLANGAANGHAENGDVHMNGVPSEAHSRFATGLILPPPDIKSIIDRTASFVARSANPLQFEDKVREGQRADPKFSFLNPADPYHGYYRHKMTKIAQGEDEEAPAGPEKIEAVLEEVEELPKGGLAALEPPPPDFILDLPPINAVDLDIIKLTALTTARRGRSFLHTLAAREARNYEFEFLRPTHSLFGYFNTLVEQYSKVLLPSKEMLEKLRSGTEEGAKWKMLEISKQHAEWERLRREKEAKKHDDKEAERTAFAEIDWHDYAIVQTIEFTTADANSELPPPMSVNEMVSRTLAQKKMAAMIMEDTADEVEATAAGAEADGTMDVSDDEDAEAQERKKRDEEERQKEFERARAIQATSMDASGPMKIRTDYVPKRGEGHDDHLLLSAGSKCPWTSFKEHMRIELLDPRWKSQRDALEMRRAQLTELQRGANVESSLKSLARARVDIFGTEADEEKRRREEQAEQERRKEREKVVWDGHTASKDKTLDKFQTNVNFEEQIAAIHRAKGLSGVDAANGPGIGPSVGPGVTPSLPPPPASLPAPPRPITSTPGVAADPAFAAATVSAGPQPASMYSAQAAPVMLPPLHYQGLDAAQPFGFQPPPTAAGAAAGMHPSRLAALAGTPPLPLPGAQVGMVRTAEQMEGAEGGGDGVPPAKKQKVGRLPGGQFYPEQHWMELHPHPISIQVQLPVDGTKAEWKLDGSVVTLGEVPVTFLVSTLRDHVVRQMGSSVPLSRIMLSFGGKMLTNANTLASYNIEDEDLLVLGVRDAKKKK
ncbi:Pre-mRNA splicing factor PRP21 like protein-domain-containing protein [Phellopilus nigrolimitatus]|nr:Pre-mRNA splicing factor PRP21 like protein-domain-containing protein [Phellopilus nigrolimitatus]